MPDANIGVRLGTHLHLCCLEADSDDANRELLTLSASWPRTWTYRASRGGNWLFAAPADIPERPVRNLWPDAFGKGVECKTGLGFIVAPPSVHPSGHVYTWADGGAPWAVPLAPLPATIADEVRRLDAVRLSPARDHSPLPRAAAAFNALRTLDALQYLDANDYETWRDVGLALKHSGDAQARGVWDTWSAGSEKYDQGEQARQWDLFTPSTITLGSIFFHAKQAGWTEQRAA
jgi:hypothetical protein